MARKPDPGARDRILDAACGLFNEHGVRAVGMQQIIDACGCGKNLLYREFSGKDELIVAWLERCATDWPELLTEAADRHPDDPAEQLVAVVAVVAERASEAGFRGCAMRNAYAEFPEETHPAHRFIVAHYAARREQLRALARRAGARDPEGLADRLSLIMDGVNTDAAILGADGAVRAAAGFARDVVRAATAPLSPPRAEP
ncbi:TetR/AcrR family transcriptional regulator [Streptomyces specialis]|uniref:TetR/AcrR family transcriptional regulator n=1 Tax=Streptomyces specialis TaxID=498367 RepID=UPI00073F575A|nr:TetR/AcrR family transcriptional regulator [Streptomyces specialis]